MSGNNSRVILEGRKYRGRMYCGGTNAKSAMVIIPRQLGRETGLDKPQDVIMEKVGDNGVLIKRVDKE